MKSAPEVSVISIGALSANNLWGERSAVRTGHATTTLVRAGAARILVDPGLPAQALVARLAERANLTPADVTHVFLTSFKPDVRRALESFPDAQWLIHAPEREGVGVPMVAEMRRAEESGDEEVAGLLRREIALLQRCKPAPDALADHVDLFPLPGATPGCCGLLIAGPRSTLVVAGDAVPTAEHLAQGKVLPAVADIEAAKASLMEVVEIADLVIPGRDNLAVNPARRPF